MIYTIGNEVKSVTELSQRLPGAILDKRTKLKLSQEQLAEMIGVSNSFVGQVERGESSVSVDTLYNFIRCLELDANYLFYGSISNQTGLDELCLIASQMDNKKCAFLIEYARLLLHSDL